MTDLVYVPKSERNIVITGVRFADVAEVRRQRGGFGHTGYYITSLAEVIRLDIVCSLN